MLHTTHLRVDQQLGCREKILKLHYATLASPAVHRAGKDFPFEGRELVDKMMTWL